MPLAPVILALLSAALFGAATPVSKWLLSELNPFQLAGLLYLGAALGVAPFAIHGGQSGLPHRSDRRNRARLLGAIVAGGMLGPVALLFGLRLAEAASVSLWLNLELAATAVLGVCFFHDNLNLRGWMGVAAALTAAALLSSSHGAAGFTAGGLVLVACLCWGLDNHLTALIDGITPSQTTFWKGVTAGIVNLTIGIALGSLAASWQVLAAALAVGAVSYGASIVLYVRSAQALGATRAQVLFSSAPFFGVAFAVVFLGESLSWVHAPAAVLFVCAVALLLAQSHAHQHTHKAIHHQHTHRHDDGHHNHCHPGLPPSTRHTHQHEHEPLVHSHPHWPDLHHRHGHSSRSERGSEEGSERKE